jgi:tetratricopeptide (TPR) repeat protein
VRLESIVLCNVGIVEDALGKHDAARSSFEAAVRLARDLGDRRSEGQFLGYLGSLHARRGQLALAQGCVRAGADLLRSVSDLVSLAVLMCQVVEVESASGNQAAARLALDEAERLAGALTIQTESEVGLSLRKARALVSISA